MRNRAPALVVMAALAVGAPRVAHAQAAAADVAAARELFVQASLRSKDGRWEEARDLYAKSLRLKRAAITLYSLGVSQSKTGQLVDALESLRAFLAEPSVPATAPYEQPARDEIASLERRVARVTLQVQPRGLGGLQITVDGAAVPEAALDVARLVDPGAHHLVARAPGHLDAHADFTVGEGGTVTAPLRLVPVVVLPAPAGSFVGLAPPPPPDAPRPSPSRALPLALIGAGGAVFLAGLTVGLVGLRQGSDAPTRDGPEASAARVKTVAGDVTAGLGAATAGVGVVLLVVQRRAAPAHVAREPRLAPWLGGTSAGLSGSF